MPPVTIVMYHFVRPIAGTRWSGIKGLERHLFQQQLDYLRRHHTLVGLTDVVEAARGGRPLPTAPAVLTFDDGYADHYHHAFPLMRAAGVTGAFFPPSSAVLDRRVLDVNKVHFVLAACEDAARLVAELEEQVEAARGEFALDPLAGYRARLWAGNRFDPAEVIYLKRMLQTALPETLRARIADDLFRRHVTADESGFAEDLYLSLPQLGEMAAAGMEIGSHGHAHYWLDSLDAADQARDIDRSLDMLERVGLKTTDFFFCYPYGAYNADTLAVLRARGCAAAVTTRFQLARLPEHDLLELPRLDTNDLPKDASAPPSPWTLEALAAGQPMVSP